MVDPSTIILATGDFAELFEELIYGSGAWIGFLIVISIALLVTVSVKYGSAPMIFILIFYGLHVLANATDPSNVLYGIIIAWACVPFLAFIELKRKR